MNDWRATRGAVVVDREGRRLGVVDDVVDEAGAPVLLVRVEGQDAPLRVPFDVVDQAGSSHERIVLTGNAGESAVDAIARGETLTIPVVAEEAFAHVREVEQGRAIIEKRVETVPHVAKVEIGTDEVEVERVRRDQEVDQPPVTRQEGDTLIIPVVEEVLVVTKRYLVREEVRVTRRRRVREETLREDLRREVVTVHEERTNPTDRKQ